MLSTQVLFSIPIDEAYRDPAEVMRAVAAEVGVDARLVVRRGRTPRVAAARAAVVRRMDALGFSQQEIATAIGRDRTTVRHHLERGGAR